MDDGGGAHGQEKIASGGRRATSTATNAMTLEEPSSSECTPSAKTAIVTALPSPFGSASVPRSCSSAWRTLTPRRMWTSIVSSNFVLAVCLTRRIASAGG